MQMNLKACMRGDGAHLKIILPMSFGPTCTVVPYAPVPHTWAHGSKGPKIFMIRCSINIDKLNDL